MNLPELISPERANQLVLLAAIALSILSAGLGFWAAKTRGLIAILSGPLIYLLWQGHQWITRYDPESGYFGLDKVWVLALEAIVFVAIGAAAGWVWKRALSPAKQREE